MQKVNIDPKTITPEMLAELLLNIFRTETEIINQSTAVLKKYFELPDCIKPLLVHATSHPDQRVRLLSCICLKKRLPQHWVAQPAALQHEIKSILLAHYVNEPVAKVKENFAYVISALATILIPNNEWPELFNFVSTNCQATDLQRKELGTLLLFAVSEALGNSMESYLGAIIGILTHLISMPHQSIQKLAIKTLNCLLSSNISSDSFGKLESLIPSMIKTVLELQDNEALLQEVFENLIELVDIPKILQSQLSFLINAALTIGKNKDNSVELRKIALCFIESAAQSKGKFLKKDRPTLLAVLQVGFEVASEDEEEYDKEEETPIDAALDMIEQFAIKVPNTTIFPLIIKGCEELLKSTDPLKRRAGLLVLGTVSKGVRDPMTENIEEILMTVLQCMSDPSSMVQEAGVLALCYFSENLSPEIVDYHSKILPVLLQAFSSKTEKTRNKLFYAIEMFCSNLNEQEIQPYLHPLLECLVSYLETPELEIKRSVLMALASVITAAQQQIAPYYTVLMEKLGKCVFMEEDELVKAKATIAIGHLAVAGGLELFKPYLEKCSQKVLSEVQKGGPLFEMNEAGYSYFGDIAKLLGDQFTHMLPTLVPIMAKSCSSGEGIKHEFESKAKEDIALGDSSESEEEDLRGISVRTAFLDEKITALHSLGRFAKCCPKGFLPFMKGCIQSMEGIWDYFHESVRYQLVQTLQEFVEGVNLAFFGSSHPKPVPGLPPKVKMCDDAARLYFEHVLPKYLDTLKNDEDKEVVTKTLESICDLIKAIGSAIVGDRLKDYIDCILLLLNQKAMCMQEEAECDSCSDDGEGNHEHEHDDEMLDHDEMLIVNLVELIQDIAKSCGPAVIPYYKEVIDGLVKYTKPPHPENDWVVALGGFSELFRALPEILPTYIPKILPVCIKGCESGKNDLSRNSAYCLGIIVEYGKDLALPYINEILAALKSAYELPKAQEPKDNAISSLLRVLVAHFNKVPLELVLPAIFNNLPLNGDIEENNNVARSLIMLPAECLRYVEKYMDKALLVCFKVILDKKCNADEELKGLVGMFITKLSENEVVRREITGLISKMSETEKETLRKYVRQNKAQPN
eukprot:TRINITY_DN628_c0_g1_i1.p1 TRINITY_DN628_c0_g1~~TRINITY_DN628_c0_g1_i1.p1  ORF type:complete len:1088 (+),score=135.90 TRINITY_DN628_c0_g1_i1:26182-29445(+)